MTSTRTGEEVRRRRDFLGSCCFSFVQYKMEDAKAQGRPLLLYYSESMLDKIVEYDFILVDAVRKLLDNPEHRIDKHKVPACLMNAIVFAQPIRTSRQLQRYAIDESVDSERTEINAEFAWYAGLNLLSDWHEAAGRKMVLSARAFAFLNEQIKWLAFAVTHHCIALAQMIYLLEQLCFVEQEFARKSCRKAHCTERLKENKSL